MQLIDNKSNCLQIRFREHLKDFFNNIKPFLENLDFSNAFEEGKNPINFDLLTQQQIEDVRILVDRISRIKYSES